MGRMKSEKFWQLRAGKEQRHAAFEARHDTLRDEMHQDSGFGEPGDEGDERDWQRRAGRQRGKAYRSAAGKLGKGRADDQRNCGSYGGNSVARTAKDPEDQSAEQTSVKTRFGRQVRERRITQR